MGVKLRLQGANSPWVSLPEKMGWEVGELELEDR